MLSFVFFIFAVLAAAVGFVLLAPGLQQIAAFAVAALFLALFAISMVRSSNRPWR